MSAELNSGVLSMVANVSCPKCGLGARFCRTSDAPETLEFDASEFRNVCKTASKSKNYECPDLVAAIKTAVWQSGTADAEVDA